MEESAERYGVGLDEIIEQMRITDDIILFRAIKAANKMLREKNILAATICDRLVNAGIVQILVRILESDKYGDNFSFQTLKKFNKFSL